MLVLTGILSAVIIVCNAEATSNYFCADMNPQPHIIIEQLMGMWYGIEIINHLEERHYNKVIPSCPIIHLSEDKSYSTTHNPLHRNYNYGYNYGHGHGYNINNNPDGYHDGYNQGYNQGYNKGYNQGEVQGYGNHRTQQGRTVYIRDRDEQVEYDRNTTYSNYKRPDYVRRLEQDMKRLRLYWDESGSSTEYHLRYNISRSGFWISEGPQNGSSLDPQFSHFAGTIQVIKAVGSHLVLTFCHQLPERQLYSILLARENKLDNIEVHGVHNLLFRKGLTANAIKRVCSGSSANSFHNSFFSIVVCFLLYQMLNL